jgi:hypothetical protein
MANVTGGRPRAATHPEEWFSILLALVGTAAAVLFIGYDKDFEPATRGVAWAVPVWIGFIYLIIQMSFLLFSTSRGVGALGVLDSILAIVPVVAGLVILVELILGQLSISNYQKNTLAVLIVAGLSEFLLTIWARFVLNRRTISYGGDTG